VKRASHQGLSERLISSGAVVGRQHLAADAYDMATLAAEMIAASGSTAHLGIVFPKVGRRHAFCVAGYEPHARSDLHIRDMSEEGWCANAWVIDPWMNVSCPFQDYPAQAKMKFRQWSRQSKYIITHPRRAPEDPSSDEFGVSFFESSQLKFIDGSFLVKSISQLREKEELQRREIEAEIFEAATKALPIMSPF
jgi:hypothetical protein